MSVCLKTFTKVANSGDRFSQRLAEWWFGQPMPVCDGETAGNPNLILVGSILEWADEATVICGAGLLGANGRLSVAPRRIVSVRGPLTAARLHQDHREPTPPLMADPGVLAPQVFPDQRAAEAPVGIIPHYVDRDCIWVQRWRERGVPVIDVAMPLEEFFAQLQRCRVILSSSLHGLIFAHAYERPALWIELSSRVLGDGFKFYDYYGSLGVAPERVLRRRIQGDEEPAELAALASLHSPEELQVQALEALELARRELATPG